MLLLARLKMWDASLIFPLVLPANIGAEFLVVLLDGLAYNEFVCRRNSMDISIYMAHRPLSLNSNDLAWLWLLFRIWFAHCLIPFLVQFLWVIRLEAFIGKIKSICITKSYDFTDVSFFMNPWWYYVNMRVVLVTDRKHFRGKFRFQFWTLFKKAFLRKTLCNCMFFRNKSQAIDYFNYSCPRAATHKIKHFFLMNLLESRLNK